MARNVHFVGSVGLDTSEEVFAEIGSLLRDHILRCPDGEMGGRRLWISYQHPFLRSNPALISAQTALTDDARVSQLKLANREAPEKIHFTELGYAREALYSYQLFCKARNAGAFRPKTRFQVSLPTPFAIISAFIVKDDVPLVLPVYTAAMLKEVERICAAIPHQDLAIQWDVCIELLMWDGRLPRFPSVPSMDHFFEQEFKQLSGAIPADVELGFHLCYGDLDAKHFVQPLDLGKCVEMANLLARAVGRDINWIHMPVPQDRDDEAYFAPLRNWQGGSSTELFLGLVHFSDGAEGTRLRMAVAERVGRDFGIATECGMGRVKTKEQALELLRIHAQAIQ